MSEHAEVMGRLAKVEGIKYVVLTYRSKGTNEIAKHTILLGVNTEEVYRADVEMLQTLRVALTAEVEACDGAVPVDLANRVQACNELLSSKLESLTVGIGNNSQYTHREPETYTYIANLPGVRMHNVTGELYVNGMSQGKVVIEAGQYKEVKSKPLTIAKNAIRAALPSGKFRQFSIPMIRTFQIDGEKLIID